MRTGVDSGTGTVPRACRDGCGSVAFQQRTRRLIEKLQKQVLEEQTEALQAQLDSVRSRLKGMEPTSKPE
jgi:uncharacterized coiled-coil protein SlyX